MKLISSSTSPYAQKVRVVAIEKGINLGIENVLPLSEGSIEVIKNPLGKVPTLVLDDGDLLYDSAVICAYLDSLTEQPKLIPDSGPELWATQRSHALGDGIMDAAFSTVMEQKRSDAEPSQFWLNRWEASIERSVAEIAKQAATSATRFDLGTISCACALNYLAFRLPDLSWKSEHPNLLEWFEEITNRESFNQTTLG